MRTFTDKELERELRDHHQNIDDSNKRLLDLAAGRNTVIIPDTDVYWLAAKAHMKQFHYSDDKF